jgi:hypothetical protein
LRIEIDDDSPKNEQAQRILSPFFRVLHSVARASYP